MVRILDCRADWEVRGFEVGVVCEVVVVAAVMVRGRWGWGIGVGSSGVLQREADLARKAGLARLAVEVIL